MSKKKPCCPSCGEAEKHVSLDVVRLRLHTMVKEVVALLTCEECGTVFDPRYVKHHEL